jgi:hypothetical protein
MPTLVRLVRRRVSFENDGRRLENLFRLVFQCEPWPSPDTRELILDLVRLRNWLVHGAGQDWSQDGVHSAAYALQFRTVGFVNKRRYGDLCTYTVDRSQSLLFLRDAGKAIIKLAIHLEQQLGAPSSGVPTTLPSA